MANLAAIEQAINSNEWQSLVNELLDYVENYAYKVVPARAGFQT
jgi:hypothetical protein